MRTTLTLDADVARTLKSEVRRGRVSFKEAVNRALRRGLGIETKRNPKKRFRIRPHDGGLVPGIDPGKVGQWIDELDAEARVSASRHP